LLTLPARKFSARILPAAVLVLTACCVPLTGCGWLGGGNNSKPTVRLTADPTSITPGSSSTLSVTADNATKVTISGSDGSSYSLPAGGGSQSVKPSTTTTYTATATGSGSSGSATAQATVTVQSIGPPTVTISASPTTINAGASSTLTVTAANATSVTVAGSDGSSYTLASTGGTQTVSPSVTTTYVATAAGPGGTASQQQATANVTVTVTPGAPTVTIAASPTSIASGNSATLNVTATNATSVTVSGSDGSNYTLANTGGTQTVTPSTTTTYTATASGVGPNATAQATVTVVGSGTIQSISHVIFMMQENRSFDSYFGMLNPYKTANGWDVGSDGNTYLVDGIDDKLNTISNEDDEGTSFKLFKFTSTCVDDMSSAWLESYGDVNRYDFSTTRKINMDGFVHNAEGFDKSCAASGNCSGGSGAFTDSTGERAMGYYDQGFLNYYYYMASQFAVSDRWFTPVSSKTVDNRIATMSGGTTQGLTRDPGSDDHLGQVDMNTIFQELDKAGVSWKIYYSVTQGNCVAEDECSGGANGNFPASEFEDFTYSVKYVYSNQSGTACTPPTQPSSVVGDTSNSFCIDPTHIAPLNDSKYGYFADLKNNTLPSFAYIEPGFSHNDEHPGYQGNILAGQAQVASIINALMGSQEWGSSVFFLAYDEAGGPYDHVPPVPGHSNDYTDPTVGSTAIANIPDISTIAVNADQYNPCVPPNGTPQKMPNGGYCDLLPGDPGTQPTDAPAQQGFAAQLGFRVPNLVISPFTIAHYVSHIPMDHTAVIKFVESRFIGSSAHLTARDAAQPNLLDFFDFTSPPWATPPSPPAPNTTSNCNAQNYGQ
jgi:phospholipase C